MGHAGTAAPLSGKASWRSSPSATALTPSVHMTRAAHLAQASCCTAAAFALADAPSPSSWSSLSSAAGAVDARAGAMLGEHGVRLHRGQTVVRARRSGRRSIGRQQGGCAEARDHDRRSVSIAMIVTGVGLGDAGPFRRGDTDVRRGVVALVAIGDGTEAERSHGGRPDHPGEVPHAAAFALIDAPSPWTSSPA